MVEEIKLKVGELTGREDFGRGIARLDTKLMSKIGAKEGDILEIEGKNTTGAVAIRSYPADIGLNILRVMDWLEKIVMLLLVRLLQLESLMLKKQRN